MTDGNNTIRRLLKEKRLTFVAYYPDGDITACKENLSKIPSGWKATRRPDETVKDSRYWDILATMSIYLLDKDKTVLLNYADYDRLSA